MLAKLEKEASFTYFTNILMYRGLIAFADVNHHRATCPRRKQGAAKAHRLNRGADRAYKAAFFMSCL